MLNLIRKLLGRQYHYLNTIKLSESALRNNYNYLSSLDINLKVSPVLKSNAYGHGLIQIAKMVEKLNPPFICVDSLHEAYRIKKCGVKTPILVMGYINPENLKVKKLPFSYAVYSLDHLKKICQYQPQAGIHLKVDTGMHRMGIPMEELEDLLKKVKKFPDIKIEGVMSHLATTTGPLFKLQLENFIKAKVLMKKYGFNPARSHLAASEGILDPKVRKQITKVSNMVRAGKALYGYALTVSDTNLKPVLTLTTTIAQIKQLKKGDTVGYDGTFKANEDLVMAVLPIGYYDGVDRRLSNTGVMMIDDTVVPIIGRVSMNITTIDISKVTSPFVGQTVTVISPDPKNPNSISAVSKLCDTIPHEVLVHLADSTARIVVK